MQEIMSKKKVRGPGTNCDCACLPNTDKDGAKQSGIDQGDTCSCQCDGTPADADKTCDSASAL
jgi:hypothetical protein